MLLRAPWPLWPRPAVLPPLPPMPRPTRRRPCLEPGAGFRSWILIGIASDLFDGDEMRDLGDHAPDLRPVGVLDGVVDPAQPERAQRPALLGLGADRGADHGDPKRSGHRCLTSVISGRRLSA